MLSTLNMLLFLMVIQLLLPVFVIAKGWTYDNQQAWSHESHYCHGKSQSPIDVHFNMSHFDPRLKQLVLAQHSPKALPVLINNGHTAQINFKNHFSLQHLAPESEDYKVEQVHFHWGHPNDDHNGSEHLLEGRTYPLEMHIVTYSNWFANIREAMTTTRGLAVVGVFFELSHYPNPDIQPIVDALASVRRQGDKVNVADEFNLKTLIGEKRMRHYYRYDGSLTTPPCYESVVWTVLKEPLTISFSQLQSFLSLVDEHTKAIHSTHRKIQPLGTRKLFRSYRSHDISDGSHERSTSSGNNRKYSIIINGLLFVLTNLILMNV